MDGVSPYEARFVIRWLLIPGLIVLGIVLKTVWGVGKIRRWW